MVLHGRAIIGSQSFSPAAVAIEPVAVPQQHQGEHADEGERDQRIDGGLIQH